MTAHSTTSSARSYCSHYIRTLVDSTLTTNVASDGCQGHNKVHKLQRIQTDLLERPSGGYLRKEVGAGMPFADFRAASRASHGRQELSPSFSGHPGLSFDWPIAEERDGDEDAHGDCEVSASWNQADFRIFGKLDQHSIADEMQATVSEDGLTIVDCSVSMNLFFRRRMIRQGLLKWIAAEHQQILVDAVARAAEGEGSKLNVDFVYHQPVKSSTKKRRHSQKLATYRISVEVLSHTDREDASKLISMVLLPLEKRGDWGFRPEDVLSPEQRYNEDEVAPRSHRAFASLASKLPVPQPPVVPSPTSQPPQATAATGSPLKRTDTPEPEALFDALSMKMLSCNNVWLSMLPAKRRLCDYVELGMNVHFKHWLDPKVQTALTECMEPEFECLRWNVAMINGAKIVPTVTLMDPSVTFHSKTNTYVAVVTLMAAITLHSL